MTAAQRKQLVASLKALIAELEKRGRRPVVAERELDTDRADEEDEQPLEEMLQSITSNRNANDARVLTLARAALDRAERTPAELGECQGCGDEIPFARLKAMPYAELCVGCQAARDPQATARRKLTDYQ